MNDALLFEEDARVAEALRFAGVDVKSVYDLVNTRNDYSNAIPTLVRLLGTVRHPRIKEGIARALAVKQSSPFATELIREFREMAPRNRQEELAKWAIGAAIAVSSRDDVVPEIIALLRDQQHGWTRFMLPMGLTKARIHRTEAVGALIALLNDDEVALQSTVALSKLKAWEALNALNALLRHPNREIRGAAAKAVRSLEKS